MREKCKSIHYCFIGSYDIYIWSKHFWPSQINNKVSLNSWLERKLDLLPFLLLRVSLKFVIVTDSYVTINVWVYREMSLTRLNNSFLGNTVQEIITSLPCKESSTMRWGDLNLNPFNLSICHMICFYNKILVWSRLSLIKSNII